MPRRDGTGPMCMGSMTGRGLGFCTGVEASRYGRGFGMGVGFGNRPGFGGVFPVDRISSKRKEEMLQEQKEILRKQPEDIDKELEDL